MAPQTVWCDNKDCIFYDEEWGVCDVYRLDIKGGVCVGSSRNGRNVTSNDVVEKLRTENDKLRELVRDMWTHREAVPYGMACEVRCRMEKLGIEVES